MYWTDADFREIKLVDMGNHFDPDTHTYSRRTRVSNLTARMYPFAANSLLLV